MRKVLVVFIIVLSALNLNAQGKIYCELLGTQVLLSKKVTVSVDFGQQTNLFSDNRLVDEDGKVIIFNSMIDAMNYMGTMGWEFEQAYVVTTGSGATSSNVYHWLLSKYVGEDGDPNELRTRSIAKANAEEEAQENIDELKQSLMEQLPIGSDSGSIVIIGSTSSRKSIFLLVHSGSGKVTHYSSGNKDRQGNYVWKSSNASILDIKNTSYMAQFGNDYSYAANIGGLGYVFFNY